MLVIDCTMDGGHSSVLSIFTSHNVMPRMFGLFLKKLTQVSGQLKQLN